MHQNHHPAVHYRSTARLITAIALALYVGVYAVVTYSGVLEGVALLWWSDMAWTVISLAAALKCWHTARLQAKANVRHAWYAFSIAALFWFLGMLVWDYMELVSGIITPYPSAADLFFTGFALSLVAGIFLYRDPHSMRFVNRIQIGNLGIIVCTVIIVTSVILYPQIKISTESDLFIGFAVAYAVVFMSAFIFGLFSYWFYVWTRDRKVFPLILTALFMHAVADTLYAFELLGKSYGPANYLNVVWVVAFAVQYWAAVEQDRLNDKQNPKTETAGQVDGVRNLEGLAPSLSLLTILLTLWFFGRNLDYGFMKFVFFVSLLLMGFLVVREWSMSRALTHARNNLEEQVKERTLQLTRTNRELEAYSYSIAHDLRSPLRSVTGFSQILLEEAGEKLNQDEQDYLQRIASGGNNMARLIDEILELSRVTRSTLRTEIVDMSALSQKVAGQFVERDPERNIEFSVQPDMKVQGDGQLLSLVMENLIGNAFKYTSTQSRARVEIGVTQLKGEPVYFVRDNGVGFDMAYSDKLFMPFQRLHSNEDFPGSGVGLATVQRIVERHGGRVWAEAIPDNGATFYMTLS